MADIFIADRLAIYIRYLNDTSYS